MTTVPLTLGAAPPHRPNVPLAPTGTALQVAVGLRTTSPLMTVAAVLAAPAVAARANEPAAPKLDRARRSRGDGRRLERPGVGASRRRDRARRVEHDDVVGRRQQRCRGDECGHTRVRVVAHGGRRERRLAGLREPEAAGVDVGAVDGAAQRRGDPLAAGGDTGRARGDGLIAVRRVGERDVHRAGARRRHDRRRAHRRRDRRDDRRNDRASRRDQDRLGDVATEDRVLTATATGGEGAECERERRERRSAKTCVEHDAASLVD